MRIALVSPAFPYPQGGVYVGIERLALGLVHHLTGLGHTVDVFTTYWNGGGPIDHYEEVPIRRTHDLSTVVGRFGALFDLHYYTWGRGLLSHRRALNECDLVHALAPLSSTRDIVSMGLPLITHFHHYEEIKAFSDVLSKPFHHWIERRAYRNSTLLLAPSRDSARSLVANFAVSADDTRVVPHAVDLGHFPLQSRKAREDVKILYVGEHEKRKGLDHLLKAMAILRHLGLDAKLITVGSGSHLARLKNSASKLGISNRVEFRGYIPDSDQEVLPKVYSEADIFVLPSLLEGFGIVLLEAMATGLPIVATDVSAIPEVVGEAGILVSPRDPEALARALRLLIDDKTRRSELGKKGRKRVESLYTWDRVIRRLVEVYEEAVEVHSLKS